MRLNSKSLLGLAACASLAGLGSTAPLTASDAAEDAKRFGARSSVLDISLSPSGNKLAWIGAGEGYSEVLYVVDLTDGQGIRPITKNGGFNTDLAQCDWATDERLVCQVEGMSRLDGQVLAPFSRMFAIGHDGSDVVSMTERQSSRALWFNQSGGRVVALDVNGKPGNLFITRSYVPEETVGTRLASSKQGLGVDRFDVTTGKRRLELQPDEGAGLYMADDQGHIRLKARFSADSRGVVRENSFIYLVRGPGEKRWERLPPVVIEGEEREIVPAAIDAGSNRLFAYTTLSGYDALIAIALDGSGTVDIIASRSDVDVDGLVRIGRQQRVVGVTYATEKRSVEYFDEELASIAKALRKALPNQPLINFAGANQDESKLVLIASSDTDPGTVYLFDKGTKQLQMLLAMRDALVDRQMGEMRPVTYPASDGTQIPGYLTLPPGSEGKNLPAIVLPHGGLAARDYWGFDWIVQFFTARGYAVLQPNYRGSAGYGEAWFGRNGYQAWDVAVGDVNDAGKWLVSEGIADPEKLAIVGRSYGGYAALQSQVVDPDLYRAVVAIAPVTDLEYLRSDAREYTNFRFRNKQLGDGPHIAAGSPRRHAEKFRAPVALYHGTFDVNVEVRHSKGMVDALKDAGKSVSYMEFEGLQHGLRDSNARAQMLGSIDSFLSESLGD